MMMCGQCANLTMCDDCWRRIFHKLEIVKENIITISSSQSNLLHFDDESEYENLHLISSIETKAMKNFIEP